MTNNTGHQATEGEIPETLKSAVTQFILRHYGTISEKELAERIAVYVYLNFCEASQEAKPSPVLRLEALIKKQKQYIEFLGKHISDSASYMYVHGILTPQNEVDRGIQFRKEIAELESESPSTSEADQQCAQPNIKPGWCLHPACTCFSEHKEEYTKHDYFNNSPFISPAVMDWIRAHPEDKEVDVPNTSLAGIDPRQGDAMMRLYRTMIREGYGRSEDIKEITAAARRYLNENNDLVEERERDKKAFLDSVHQWEAMLHEVKAERDICKKIIDFIEDVTPAGKTYNWLRDIIDKFTNNKDNEKGGQAGNI
jgi:hypothetical protein